VDDPDPEPPGGGKGLVEVGGGPARAEADVTSLVDLLSGLGVRPRDVVVIFQMLKRLGALKAELVLM
jgi:flagellar basal body P-ring protein FlgI